jgi:hypothetical protein
VLNADSGAVAARERRGLCLGFEVPQGGGRDQGSRTAVGNLAGLVPSCLKPHEKGTFSSTVEVQSGEDRGIDCAWVTRARSLSLLQEGPIVGPSGDGD